MNDAAEKADCKREPGEVAPVINRDRCEGKADCLAVCPYGVFEIGVLPAADRKPLSLRGKIKGFAHGWKQAFAVNADQCHACGLCVAACPEKAIVLRRVKSDLNPLIPPSPLRHPRRPRCGRRPGAVRPAAGSAPASANSASCRTCSRGRSGWRK